MEYNPYGDKFPEARDRLNQILEQRKTNPYIAKLAKRVSFIYDGYGVIFQDRKPHEIKILKDKLVANFGELCQVCKTVKYQQLHHKDQNHCNNEISNAILVCCKCHQELHKHLPIAVATSLDEVEIVGNFMYVKRSSPIFKIEPKNIEYDANAVKP